MTSLRLVVAFAATSFAVATAGCVKQQSCTEQLVYGLNVTVDDSRTGANVCNATVTARDGAYSETLRLFPPVSGDAGTPTSCTYTGAGERAGSYTIDIVAPGHTAKTLTADVIADDCHVTPVQPKATLDPS